MDATPSKREDEAMADVRAMVERHLAGTGCVVVDVERIGTDDWSGQATTRYRLHLDALLADLQRGPTTIEVMCVGAQHWCDLGTLDEFVRTQRMRADRVTARGGAHVDAVLAAHLTAQTNLQPCRRLLFSMIQGVRSRHTLVPGVTNARLLKGRLIARVELGAGASWRDGELTLKGRSLPETMAAALSGRPVEDLIRHPLLEGMVIRRARNTREGLVAAVAGEGVPYDEVWRRLGG